MNRTEAQNLLGVGEGATVDEINKAYRKKSKELHPDAPGGSDEAFKKLSEAKDRLTKPEQTFFKTGDGFQNMHQSMWEAFQQAQANMPKTHIFIVTPQELFAGFERDILTKEGISQKIKVNPGMTPLTTIQISLQDLIQFRMINDQMQIDFGWEHYGDIYTVVEISPFKMIQGGGIKVTLIDGAQGTVHVPAGSKTGTLLKVKGKGYWANQQLSKRGDAYFRAIPKIDKISEIDEKELEAFIEFAQKELDFRNDKNA